MTNKIAQNKDNNEKVWKQAINKLKKVIAELNLKAKQETNQSHPQLVENIELDNISIFACEDLILYKGIIEFYLKQYSASLNVQLHNS